jgi:hypothetical protein
MRWLVGMVVVLVTYAVASAHMPNFEESARPTVLLLLIAMTVMGLRSTRE